MFTCFVCSDNFPFACCGGVFKIEEVQKRVVRFGFIGGYYGPCETFTVVVPDLF
jgi:hypothetical protein